MAVSLHVPNSAAVMGVEDGSKETKISVVEKQRLTLVARSAMHERSLGLEPAAAVAESLCRKERLVPAKM
jgi:hypothetical protein